MAEKRGSGAQVENSILEQSIELLLPGLKYSYQPAWEAVLGVVTGFMKAIQHSLPHFGDAKRMCFCLSNEKYF